MTFEDNADDYFELYDNEDLVLVLPYDGDIDDRVLEEIRPRFVVMYEPNPSFVRRVEVYRASHPNRHLKAFFLYYANSVEEQRYLSAVRKEKDAFTRLIREKGNMALVIQNDVAVEDPQEFFLRTVNTRIAGGGRVAATAEPPRVFSRKSWLMTGHCGFSRISIVVAEFAAWSEFGCCSCNVDGGRLRSFSDDGGGEEECQGFDSEFEQWEIVQPMRDDDAVLQNSFTSHRV
jgi:hypothetical protein